MEVADAQSHGTMIAIHFGFLIFCLWVISDNVSRVTESRRSFLVARLFYYGHVKDFYKELKNGKRR